MNNEEETVNSLWDVNLIKKLLNASMREGIVLIIYSKKLEYIHLSWISVIPPQSLQLLHPLFLQDSWQPRPIPGRL